MAENPGSRHCFFYWLLPGKSGNKNRANIILCTARQHILFLEMLISQYNFGKVKKGQQVLLKFQAYQFEQYGAGVGKIDYINTTA